jgi:hypothetical protein
MSQTLGPPVYLDGPIPVAPPFSLLNTATLVPTDDERFGVGGALWPYPPGLPHAYASCSTGTFRTKADGDGWDLPIFSAVAIYLPITCSSITAHAAGFKERAEIALAAKASFGVARELARGGANPLNPFLTDANLTILAGGAAVTPDVGLSYLEDAIGATAQAGMIHATPAVAAAWNGSSGGYGVEQQGSNGPLRTTANKTLVAVDGGYIGANPSLHAPAATGQAWAFATGPVQYRKGEPFTVAESIAQSMDRAQNEVTFIAEQEFLVTWDTALQAAVLIDWTP